MTEGQKQSIRAKISSLQSQKDTVMFVGSGKQHFSKEQNEYYRAASNIETEIRTLEKLIR